MTRPHSAPKLWKPAFARRRHNLKRYVVKYAIITAGYAGQKAYVTLSRAGDSNDDGPRLDFDHRLMLQFCVSVVTSSAGLLAFRKLDDSLYQSAMAGERLAEARAGKNGRHDLAGKSRQTVFGGGLPATRI